MVEPKIIEERLRAELEGVSHVEITDLTGTRDHYEALVVADVFEGKSRVAQQRLVFAALGELMDGPIHALSLKLFTPAKYEARQA